MHQSCGSAITFSAPSALAAVIKDERSAVGAAIAAVGAVVAAAMAAVGAVVGAAIAAVGAAIAAVGATGAVVGWTGAAVGWAGAAVGACVAAGAQAVSVIDIIIKITPSFNRLFFILFSLAEYGLRLTLLIRDI